MVPKLKRLFKKQIIINKGTDWGLIVDSVVEPGPEPVGESTFWLEPEPVWRSGSGFTVDKTEEILSDILSVRFNID